MAEREDTRADVQHGTRHGLEAGIARLRDRVPDGAADDGALRVTVLASMGQLNLRGRPDDAEFASAIESVLQQALPLEPNTVSAGRHRLFWLGPDEWMVIAERSQLADIAGRLETAVRGLHAAVNDVSSGHVLMRLCGPQAGDVLAAGCTLDLHPTTFPSGRCAQTGLAKAAVLLYPQDSPAGFELVVRRSFADYLLRWLSQIAGPRGLTIDVA